MDSKRNATQVGIFVFGGLVLIASLLVSFSKGASWFHSYYHIQVTSKNVGGLKENAYVLLSGVRVGSVESTELTPSGTNVIINLRIFRRFEIHGDARFEIEQSGFLGDQFVSITPTSNALPMLGDGALVTAEPPFDLMEAARSAMGLMNRLESTVDRLNGAVGRIDRELLNDRVLTNLATAISNTRNISEKAEAAITRVDGLVASQEPIVRDTVSQVHDMTASLRQTATNLEATVASVRPDLQAALRDAAGATADLKQLTAGLQAGQGVAGALLKDPALRLKVDSMVTDLGTLSSNLARFGILYHPKGPRPTNSTPSLSRPRWE